MEKETKKSYSISLTQKEKDYNCQAFEGSITLTFRFLASLMDDACADGELDKEYVANKLREFR